MCLHISGLYYKPMKIVNDDARVVNKLKALLTDDARVVIYDCHIFVVQATAYVFTTPHFLHNLRNWHNKLECVSLAIQSNVSGWSK